VLSILVDSSQGGTFNVAPHSDRVCPTSQTNFPTKFKQILDIYTRSSIIADRACLPVGRDCGMEKLKAKINPFDSPV
jgi:hypothetical protein